VDNDRAVLKTLRGIKNELGHMRNTMASGGPKDRATARGPDTETVRLKKRITALEEKLALIARQLDEMEYKKQ
jgi:hypothetical protein